MPEENSTPTPGPDHDGVTPPEQPEETRPIQAGDPAPEPPAPAADEADGDAEHAPAEDASAAASPTEAAPTEAAPAGDAPKSRRGLLIGVIAAVVVLVLIAGGAVAAVVVMKNRPHKISTPASAGGMKRDSATEKKYAQQLKLTQQQIQKQVGAIKTSKIAVYNQSKKSRGAVGPILFYGATLTDKHVDSESPSAFIDKKLVKTFTKNKLKVLKVDIGDDGRAVCAEQTAAKTAACVWRTKDSVGELFPINPGWTAKQMSKLMISVRSDVETQ